MRRGFREIREIKEVNEKLPDWYGVNVSCKSIYSEFPDEIIDQDGADNLPDEISL